MKYDFYKIEETVINLINDMEKNIALLPIEYQDKSNKDYELDKIAGQLLKYLDTNEEFKGLLRNKMIVTAAMATTLNSFEIAKQIIYNTKENGFENTKNKLDSFFNQSCTKYNSYYTLLGIKINSEYIIDDDFKIIQYDETDSNLQTSNNIAGPEIFKKSIVDDMYRTYVAIVYTDNITIEESNNFSFENKMNSVYKKINKIVLLINLLSKKGCSNLSNFCKFENESIINAPQALGFSHCKFIPQFQSDIELNIVSLREILILIDKFNSTDNEHLNFVLSKFSDSCLRSDSSGAAVELRILLESLFSSDKDHRDPISHTVSSRGGYFLGNSPGEKLEIYIFLKSSYDIASNIVHGNYKNKKISHIDIDRLKDICSDAIIKFIKIGKFFNQDDWNKLMFGINENN